MSNRNRSLKGRSDGARSRTQSAEDLFELALRGNESQNRSAFDPGRDRKTLQLCRQVQRALIMALAGECNDDLLRDLSVDSVHAAGGTGHLLVVVSLPASFLATDVLARLNDRTGQLRTLIAGAICRKRVPMLSFVAVPTTKGGDHE